MLRPGDVVITQVQFTDTYEVKKKASSCVI